MKKQTAKKIAIVTGASSGLGREFVKQIAKSRQLDEIWVIARRRDRLEEVRRLSKVALRTIPLDLTEKSAFDVLRHALEESHPDVRMLVSLARVQIAKGDRQRANMTLRKVKGRVKELSDFERGEFEELSKSVR